MQWTVEAEVVQPGEEVYETEIVGITEDELIDYLQKGWKITHKLGNDNAIVNP